MQWTIGDAYRCAYDPGFRNAYGTHAYPLANHDLRLACVDISRIFLPFLSRGASSGETIRSKNPTDGDDGSGCPSAAAAPAVPPQAPRGRGAEDPGICGKSAPLSVASVLSLVGSAGPVAAKPCDTICPQLESSAVTERMGRSTAGSKTSRSVSDGDDGDTSGTKSSALGALGPAFRSAAFLSIAFCRRAASRLRAALRASSSLNCALTSFDSVDDGSATYRRNISALSNPVRSILVIDGGTNLHKRERARQRQVRHAPRLAPCLQRLRVRLALDNCR